MVVQICSHHVFGCLGLLLLSSTSFFCQKHPGCLGDIVDEIVPTYVFAFINYDFWIPIFHHQDSMESKRVFYRMLICMLVAPPI